MNIDLQLATIIWFALYAAFLVLLFTKKVEFKSRFGTAGLAVLGGYAMASGQATIIGLVFVTVGAILSEGTKQRQRMLKYPSWIGLVILSLGLSLHILPGFNNSLLFQSEGIGLSTLPYSLYANLDKAFAGLLILNATINLIRCPTRSDILVKFVPTNLCGLFVIFSTGYLLGVKFDPKFGELTLAFMFFNLFVTCVAEEAFFRHVVHRGLAKLSNNWTLATIVSALIFMLAHFHTGPGADKRLLLIFLSGLLYALVYQQTRSVLLSILAHFSVNIVHILLFVYPASFE